MGAGGGKLEDFFVKTEVKLGTGSFGTVWRGLNKEDGKNVAIKEINKHGPGGRKASSNYEKEVKMMSAIQHTNVVAFIKAFDTDPYFQMVIEYCDGGDLTDKIEQLGSRITTLIAADWIKQVLYAVRALHVMHIVHLDIKPANFLISHGDCESGTVLKLADFGLATYLPKADAKLFFRCGTPAFMAPEVHEIDKDAGYSKPADLWAVGTLLHMFLHGGVHPFMKGTKLNREKLARGKLPRSQTFCSGLNPFKDPLALPGKELYRQLLFQEPGERPTAQEALEHDFLCERQPRAARSVTYP